MAIPAIPGRKIRARYIRGNYREEILPALSRTAKLDADKRKAMVLADVDRAIVAAPIAKGPGFDYRAPAWKREGAYRTALEACDQITFRLGTATYRVWNAVEPLTKLRTLLDRMPAYAFVPAKPVTRKPSNVIPFKRRAVAAR